MTGSAILSSKWVRIAPHVVDTGLLLSALYLAHLLGFFSNPPAWLLTKVALLAVYIVLGTLALKRARTKRGKGIAFAAAVSTFGYMVAVALTKSPYPLS